MKKAEFLSEVKLRANNNPAVEYSNKDIKTVVEAVLDVLKDSFSNPRLKPWDCGEQPQSLAE